MRPLPHFSVRHADVAQMLRNPPLISCLCVTRGKPTKLLRAIDCFLAQRYPNKELILVYEEDDTETQQIAEELQVRHRQLIETVKLSNTPKLTLGELRNISIQRARGEYVCQWDDDDWYHNERINRQFEAIISSHRQACLLTNWLIFDEIEKQAYFSHFRLWEGSLFCQKNLVQGEVRYPAANRNEDNIFTKMLMMRGYVYPLVEAGLYIYTAHESNTWPRDHFRKMFSHSQKLNTDTSQLISDILAGHYSIENASALLRSERLLKELTYFSEHLFL